MRSGFLISLVVLAGCSQVSTLSGKVFGRADAPAQDSTETTGDPLVAPMDVTGAETGDAAAADPVPVETTGGSGTTVASLGDPARPGAWMETPLVQAETQGQVHYGDKGVNVTLIPAGGPATGGSRLSLEAMQALGMPLTDLTEVKVLF